MPASTVWKVLRRHRINRLVWMDRPTGRIVRRYERDQPGELIHIDTKKVAKIPPGGGWWAWGKPHGNTYKACATDGGGLHRALGA
jgi:hypothetical protein